MKNTVIKTGIMVAIAFFMAISSACKKEEMTLSSPDADGARSSAANITAWPDLNWQGKVALRLINGGPTNFGAVNIEITAVMVHYTDKHIGNLGWMNLPFTPKIYNLSQLKGDIATTLADNSAMPYGAIDGVRLVIGTHNTLVWLDELGWRHFAPLLMTEDDHIAGVHVDARVNESTKLFITVDFNAKGSINYEGGKTYILDPVVNLKSLDYE